MSKNDVDCRRLPSKQGFRCRKMLAKNAVEKCWRNLPSNYTVELYRRNLLSKFSVESLCRKMISNFIVEKCRQKMMSKNTVELCIFIFKYFLFIKGIFLKA